MMCFLDIQRVICEWSAPRPFVLKAWLFGSYLRQQDFRPDAADNPSDLDIALQIGAIPSYHGLAAAWILRKDQWTQELSALLPFRVHLSSYGSLNYDRDDTDSFVVSRAVSVASILLYDRATGCIAITERCTTSDGDETAPRAPSVVQIPTNQPSEDSDSCLHPSP